MSKRLRIILVCLILGIIAALTWGYTSLTGPHGKVLVRLRRQDAGGYTHTVKVRQFAGRFNTELSEEGSRNRELPVSNYEFYEGSFPITAATITWAELYSFRVSFNNGITLDCSWNETNVCWTKH